MGIIVEPPKCGSNESGALIGIGRGIAYLDYSISSYQICCRVQGSSGYTVTWLRDGIPMANTNHYDFGSDYMEYSGTMTEGCTVYTCQVDFTATLTKEEVSTICIGGIYDTWESLTRILHDSWTQMMDHRPTSTSLES